MRSRYQVIFVSGLFLLFLLFLGLRIFPGAPPPVSLKETLPKNQTAPVVLGAAKERPSPFTPLLRDLAVTPKPVSEKRGNPVSDEKSTVENKDDGDTPVLKTAAGEPPSAATPTPTPTPTLTVEQQQVQTQVGVLGGYLAADNYEALYQMMNQEFRQTFSVTDFQSMASSSSSVSRLELQEPPQINNEWAEALVKVFSTDQELGTYRAVFHRESGGWFP